MICPTCRGFGWIGRQNTGKPGMQAEPCPECMGSMRAHCCDGDQPSARDHEIEQTEHDNGG